MVCFYSSYLCTCVPFFVYIATTILIWVLWSLLCLSKPTVTVWSFPTIRSGLVTSKMVLTQASGLWKTLLGKQGEIWHVEVFVFSIRAMCCNVIYLMRMSVYVCIEYNYVTYRASTLKCVHLRLHLLTSAVLYWYVCICISILTNDIFHGHISGTSLMPLVSKRWTRLVRSRFFPPMATTFRSLKRSSPI